MLLVATATTTTTRVIVTTLLAGRWWWRASDKEKAQTSGEPLHCTLISLFIKLTSAPRELIRRRVPPPLWDPYAFDVVTVAAAAAAANHRRKEC